MRARAHRGGGVVPVRAAPPSIGSRRPLLLLSFAYYARQKEEFWRWILPNARILIDSGAFTAWKQGKTIEVKEYSEWLKWVLSMGPLEGAFTLDVVGDPLRTRSQWEFLQGEDLDTIPIFTPGEKWKAIDWYYAHGASIVAAGGLVGSQGRTGHIVRFMRHAQGRKVHWLGFTDTGPLLHYRPYSCDSSSLFRGARYGIIDVYLGGGKWDVLTQAKVAKAGGLSLQVRETIERDGLDWRRLSLDKEWRNTDDCGRLCILIQVAGHLRYTADLEERGTRMFLVTSDWKQVRAMVQVARGERRGMED